MTGFSLDVHAIALLYQPKNMTPPFWVITTLFPLVRIFTLINYSILDVRVAEGYPENPGSYATPQQAQFFSLCVYKRILQKHTY